MKNAKENSSDYCDAEKSCSIAFDDKKKSISNRAMNAQNLTFIKTQSFVKSIHNFLLLLLRWKFLVEIEKKSSFFIEISCCTFCNALILSTFCGLISNLREHKKAL
jgi:hypothetical protein